MKACSCLLWQIMWGRRGGVAENGRGWERGGADNGRGWERGGASLTSQNGQGQLANSPHVLHTAFNFTPVILQIFRIVPLQNRTVTIIRFNSITELFKSVEQYFSEYDLLSSVSIARIHFLLLKGSPSVWELILYSHSFYRCPFKNCTCN